MSQHFDVVGDVLGGYDVEGDVDGDVLGAATAAATAAIRARRGGPMLRLPPKPGWRNSQLAPGVQAPSEGMVPLPLIPQQAGGIFTSAVTNITWQGQLQKPYRAERILVSVVRTGATAVGRLMGQIFVGVDLQQAEISSLDLELIGTPTAFGTRLTLMPAPPGVLLRIPVVLSSGLTAPDTIFASMMFLGRVIH
jgi:hypothetical protein